MTWGLICTCRTQQLLERADSWQSPQSMARIALAAQQPRQSRSLGSNFISRLRSGFRQHSSSHASGTAPLLGRQKVPVQYVRPSTGPSAPLPNPFAGVLESSQPAPLERTVQRSAQLQGQPVQLSMPLQERPQTALQMSESQSSAAGSAAAKKKAAKQVKWELLLGGDEPEEPSEPGRAEAGAEESSSACISAPADKQPKLALRFQMMIDSQELDLKRQQRNTSNDLSAAPVRPSQSAAVYPADSPRQVSVPQQAHHSMPSLQKPQASSGSQPTPSQKLKRWELLLGDDSPTAESKEGCAASGSQDLQSQGTSRLEGSESAQHQGVLPDQEQTVSAQSALGADAGQQTQMIARWERMLAKREPQHSTVSNASSLVVPANAQQVPLESTSSPAGKGPASTQLSPEGNSAAAPAALPSTAQVPAPRVSFSQAAHTVSPEPAASSSSNEVSHSVAPEARGAQASSSQSSAPSQSRAEEDEHFASSSTERYKLGAGVLGESDGAGSLTGDGEKVGASWLQALCSCIGTEQSGVPRKSQAQRTGNSLPMR